LQPSQKDQELLALLKKSPDQGIEQIFRQYYAYVCQAVYRILPDESLVEDLCQEVFLELWRKRSRIEVKTSLRAYLRRAAVNRTLNYIRDQKVTFDESSEDFQLPSQLIGAAQALEAKELEKFIDLAIDQLPERCRLVFILSRFHDMSYKQIADELNISVRTVENQISKALKYLRQMLGPHL
jgi:RNA polymerase sigma-70 factor (ECF subfamily)